MFRNTYIEINQDNLTNNIKEIKKEYKDYKYYIGVVKANCYGHGEYIINDMIDSGINYLAVSSLEEALSIREKNKDIPILVFGYISTSDINIAIKNDITVSIISFSYFKELLESNITEKLKLHLKLNTGMNRLGVGKKEEVEYIVNNLKENFILEGIYTHYATSGVLDIYWDRQTKKWDELTSNIDLSKIPVVHLYNSLSLVKHEKKDYANGIRIGLLMYGFTNSTKSFSGIKKIIFDIKKFIKLKGRKISDTYCNNINIKKVLSLHSEVININQIKKNEAVGYGALYKAKENENIAVIPIGHGDGITTSYKNVSINSKLYKIVALTMDYIIVLVDDKVKLHDKVTIIGDLITVGSIANPHDNAHHILVSLANRIPRIYIKDGKRTEIKY